MLGDHVAGTALAAAALSGYTQLELNFVKAHTGTRMSRNVTVRDPVANTDDHGSRLSTKGDGTGLNYKYELFAFAMYIFDKGQFSAGFVWSGFCWQNLCSLIELAAAGQGHGDF